MVKIYTALNKEYRLPKASEIELLAPFGVFFRDLFAPLSTF